MFGLELVGRTGGRPVPSAVVEVGVGVGVVDDGLVMVFVDVGAWVWAGVVEGIVE